jgi:hypothetical protein
MIDINITRTLMPLPMEIMLLLTMSIMFMTGMMMATTPMMMR